MVQDKRIKPPPKPKGVTEGGDESDNVDDDNIEVGEPQPGAVDMKKAYIEAMKKSAN